MAPEATTPPHLQAGAGTLCGCLFAMCFISSMDVMFKSFKGSLSRDNFLF
jgi:hypothetical protein